MTPQELKNSIVQLAMRGRLVEQHPEDGSAEELYSIIQAEKKAKGINGNKNMEPVTEDAIPYDIPDNWRWVRFGDIVNYNMGKTPPRAESQWWKSEYPWVSIADMPKSGHISSTKESVSKNAIKKKFGNKVSQAGTMIMSFKLTVGRVSILDIDAVHNEAIISIYPFCDDDKTIQSYLFKLLPTVTQYGNIKNAIKGKTLNNTSICNLLIPLPPLAEQKRIVSKIEELLLYIDRYEQAWSKLEDFNKRFPSDMQKSILQTAIQGELVEQNPAEGTGEELYQQIQAEKQKLFKAGTIKKEKTLPEITEAEKPFDIPESWKWVRLSSICKTIADGDHQAPPQVTRGIPFLVISNLSSGVIDFTNTRHVPQEYFDNLSPERVAKKGDLLFTVTGSYGIPVKVDCDVSFCFQRHMALLKTLIDKEYAFYLLKSPVVKEQCDMTATGTAQKTVGLNSLRNIIVPLPPLAEQKRIVAKLEEILPICEKLKR